MIIQLFNSIDLSQFVIVTLLVLLLMSDLKFVSAAKDFCWYRIEKFYELFESHEDYNEADFEDDDDYYGPPVPSRVPVPFMAHVVSNSIKAKLPVVELGRSKLGVEQPAAAECAICLECIKGSEEIRELGNCSHLYHRECIDGWVDQGHETCPLCGRKLLPFEAVAAAAGDKEVKGVYDPWRLDRMAYLFG